VGVGNSRFRRRNNTGRGRLRRRNGKVRGLGIRLLLRRRSAGLILEQGYFVFIILYINR
jgi:hypothetical protein